MCSRREAEPCCVVTRSAESGHVGGGGCECAGRDRPPLAPLPAAQAPGSPQWAHRGPPRVVDQHYEYPFQRQPRTRLDTDAMLSVSGVGWSAEGHRGKRSAIEREQRVAPKRDDGRLLSLREDRRTWLLWAGLEIIHRLPFAPLCNRLGIDPQLPAQRRARSLRSFGQALGPVAGRPHNCCSDGVRGRGASMMNLSQRASFRC